MVDVVDERARHDGQEHGNDEVFHRKSGGCERRNIVESPFFRPRGSGDVLKFPQEMFGLALQCASNLLQQTDADISFTSLDVAQVALSHRELLRQFGLGHAQLDPSDLDTTANPFIDVHGMYSV